MTEKELMRIKRDLKARAKRKHLGKKRTGAYVYGTLRKIRGNPAKCDVITSTDWEEKDNTLVFEKNMKPVCMGQKVRSRGTYVVTGGRAPHKPSSSGRVYVKEVGKSGWGREFFPNVFNMKWVPSYNLFPVDKVSGKSRLQINGGRKKTWKIGEYAIGGIIEAKVSQDGNAVGIRNAEYSNNSTISTRLFRWPLDRNNLDLYLNELTTSYYASKIIEWIDKTTRMASNPSEPWVDTSRSADVSSQRAKLAQLIDDLARDFAEPVSDIESRYATTKNHYGNYMNFITKMSGGNATNSKIIAMALIRAGANRDGVASAMRVLFGRA